MTSANTGSPNAYKALTPETAYTIENLLQRWHRRLQERDFW
jgi:hypothetical protein